jgi:hypothetical protein
MIHPRSRMRSMNRSRKPFSTASWGRKPSPSAMFTVQFADGRTAYLVLQDNDVPAGDRSEDALRAVLRRQDAGEFPAGDIVSVTRAR